MTDPAGSLAPGAVVGQYKLLRELGQGGMGRIWLARDLALGRRVALKLLHAEAAGSQEAVQRLLDEARATARFSHPNIVTVYGAGMHWGMPFVALEHLEGESLRQRLQRGPLGVREAQRLLRAVTAAVQEAHAHGLLHRDLKPDNVVIPPDGRPRVLDFGLASAVGDGEGEDEDEPDLAGTPPYMAPELWRGESAGPAGDVWALGVMLQELLDGQRPWAGLHDRALVTALASDESVPGLRRQVPEALRRLLARCLAKVPAGRPSVEELRLDLERLLRGAPAGDESVEPFRGLETWAEGDAGRFRGREAEVTALVERLRRQPLLTVVGPSGAGKSSFVRAGVIPRLREHGTLRLLDLRPGRRPLRALASCAARALETNLEEPLEELRQAPGRLGLRLAELAEREGCQVLIFVDQLEELVTLCQDAQAQRAFMRALGAAADDPLGPVRVICTLRDAFLGLLASEEASSPVLGRIVVLRNPGPAALQAILGLPLQEAGYGFDDPSLVGEMVQTVQGEPAALPMLQVAGRMLWERRDRERKLLLRSAYQAMGGIGGALAHHADSVLAGLTPAQLDLARELLLRLVAADSPAVPGHRQVVRREKLLAGLDRQAAEVLDHLVRGGLVVVRQARQAPASDVAQQAELELAHESLLRSWRQLARWIERSSEQLAFLAEMEQVAALWQRRGERREELWRGAALQEALSRAQRLSSLPEAVRRFLDAGQRRARQRRLRSRILVAGVLLLALAVTSFTALQAREARRQGAEAQQQRQQAEDRQAEVLREGALAAWDAGQQLEARARLRDALELRDSLLARALWWQQARDTLRWAQRTPSRVLAVAVSPDGRQVAAGCSDNSVLLYDTASQQVRSLALHEDKVTALDWAPGGALLASGGLDGQLLLFEPTSGERRLLGNHPHPVRSVVFSPAGELLASADAQGLIRTWSLSNGALQSWQGHSARITELAFSADGLRLVSASMDGSVRLWSVSDGQALGELLEHASGEFEGGVALHPDGQLLADGGPEHSVRLTDARDLSVLRELHGHSAPITALRFDPQGRWLASASQDETLRLWDLEDEDASFVLRGHRNWVNDLDFGPAGLLASGGRDQQLRLWSLQTLDGRSAAAGHAADVLALAFAPGGGKLVTGGNDGTVRIWDTASGSQRLAVPVPSPEILGVAVSPDGATLAAACGDGSIRLLQARSGRELRQLPAGGATVLAMHFDEEGLRAIDATGGLRRWDAAGAQRYARRGELPVGLQGRFGPQGALAAVAGSDGLVRIFDGRDGGLRAELRGHSGRAVDAAIAPDGRCAASVGRDRRLRLWDLDSGQGRILARLAEAPFSVAFHPDGQQLGATTHDGSVLLFDLQGGQRLLGRHRVAANAIRFAPDGSHAATTAEDGTAQLWELPDGRALRRAPLMTHHPAALLSQSGWQLLQGEVAAWPATLASQARIASQDPAGAGFCMQTWDGRLLRLGGAPLEREFQPVTSLLALEDSCAALTVDGQAWSLQSEREPILLTEGASTMARWQGQLLVATDEAVLAFQDELSSWRQPTAGRVSALARQGEALLLGRDDGSLERLPVEGSETDPLEFEDEPRYPVTALLPTEDGLLAAGFGDGSVGLWSLADGALLFQERLYGPVIHLTEVGGSLHAASEMGASLRWDLQALRRPYCELLQEVWQQVPVVWRERKAVLAEPPSGHVCR